MIDSWLPGGGWPEAVIEAIAHFRQGHILMWDSIAYGAAFANPVCIPTAEVGSEDAGYVKVESTWPYVIITSQTCDICEEGKRKRKMPWIAVSPVYDILPHLHAGGQAKQIRANGFGYLVPLTDKRFADPSALWIADLRVEYPLEKSVLVGHEPIEAFAVEADYSYFAEKLASRRNRPAIDARVRELVTGPLGIALNSGAIDHEPIIEMRLQCGPRWDLVEFAKLFAIVKDNASVEYTRQQFKDWYDVIDATLPADLILLLPEIVEYSKFSYKQSQQTVPVDYSDASE